MKLKILGIILLIWGIGIAPMTYWSAKYSEETTTISIVIAGGVCILFIGLGIWLLRRKPNRVYRVRYQ